MCVYVCCDCEGHVVADVYCLQVGSVDTSYFDEEFTSEPVVDSVVTSSALSESKGSTRFDGFTFVDKSTLSGDE